MVYLKIGFLFSISFLLLLSTPVHGIDLDEVICTEPVTLFPDTNYAQTNPQTDGRFVAWETANSEGSLLSLYDIGADGVVHTFDDNHWNIYSNIFGSPVIADGKLAFYDYENYVVRVCEITGGCIPGPYQTFDFIFPSLDARDISMDGNILIWTEPQSMPSGSDKIVVQNLATGVRSEILANFGAKAQLRGKVLDHFIIIDEKDGNVSYWEPNFFEIKIYDTLSGEMHSLFSSASGQMNLHAVQKYGEYFLMTIEHYNDSSIGGFYSTIVNASDYSHSPRRIVASDPINYFQQLSPTYPLAAVIDGFPGPYQIQLHSYRDQTEKTLYTSRGGPLFFGGFELDKLVFTEWNYLGNLSFSIQTKVITCNNLR